MKRFFLILTLTLAGILPAAAQTPNRDGGFMVPADEEGIPIFTLPTVNIIEFKGTKKGQKQFDNEAKKFDRLRQNVMMVYPYAREASKNLKIVNAELARISSPADQEKFLKSRENFLFGKYEGKLKDLTVSQGKILIKLVDRETGSNTYSLIRDMKSGTAAFFWQGIGKIFGYDLKKEYNPQEELAIEVIIAGIEKGKTVTYYDYLEALAQR